MLMQIINYLIAFFVIQKGFLNPKKKCRLSYKLAIIGRYNKLKL